jgi:hypothetical protein
MPYKVENTDPNVFTLSRRNTADEAWVALGTYPSAEAAQGAMNVLVARSQWTAPSGPQYFDDAGAVVIQPQPV